AEEQFVAVPGLQAADARYRQNRNVARVGAAPGIINQFRWTTVETRDVQSLVAGHELLNDSLAFRGDDGCAGEGRRRGGSRGLLNYSAQLQPQHFASRRIFEREQV